MNETLDQSIDGDIAELKLENAQLSRERSESLAEIKHLKLLVEKFREELRLMRSRHFAASSEASQYQARLFDEAEQVAAEQVVAETPLATVPVAAPAKTKSGRRPLPTNLPRFREVHALPSMTCQCGHPLTMIEPIRSEQLDIIPAQLFVREHVRERGVCRACNTPPVTADLPPQPFPKSNASPGLIAYTGVGKFVDATPLYRQSEAHARMNIDVPRQSLAGYMVKGGTDLTPLVNLLTDVLLASGAINMDETTVQVLKEPKRPAQTKSTMWVMRGGPPGQVAVRFEYDVSHSGAVVDRLLAGYQGYLQRDGLAVYKRVSGRDGIVGLGCFAHVRRKFVDALKGMDPKSRKHETRTEAGLRFITDLYAIEQRIKAESIDVRKATREAESVPILGAFKAWLDAQQVSPASGLGKAIRYTLREWPYLTNYCLDGRLSIDNNAAENAIRPFVLGRKNWMFSDTQAGAVASANFYTVIGTCKANGINPYAYLKHVFTELPKATSLEDFEALLPWNVSVETLQAMVKVPKLEQT